MPLGFGGIRDWVSDRWNESRTALRQIDPTLSDSHVRRLLREFDSAVIVPIVDELKRNIVPPTFAAYMASLDAQASGRKQKLPDEFKAIVKSEFSSIDLDKVRFADNINTWHGQAITVYHDIYFPIAKFDITKRSHIRWMIHELEHVVQYQAVGGVAPFLLKYFVQGGMSALNNGSFNVHDSIPLEEDAENKSERIYKSVADALSATDDAPAAGPAVTQIAAIAGSHPSIPVPSGFHKSPVDLNWGAGGDYIYLCYQKSNGPPVTDIKVIAGGSSSISAPSGFTKIPVDLNKGAGGKFIYVCYKRGGAKAITGISIIAGDNSGMAPPSGYVKDPVDLNWGSGGKYIYLCYKQ